MVLILLIAMIGVPILEIAVFIQAGSYLGLWPTIGAVVLTAVVGSALLRYQGLSTLTRAQESLAAGQLPMTEVFDGFCILVGGALLLTPGFITDAVGFLLLIPPVRVVFRRWAGHYIISKGEMHVWTEGHPSHHGHGRGGGGGAGSGTIIDGEFEEVDPRDEAGSRDVKEAGHVPDSDRHDRRREPPVVVPPRDP